MSAQWSVVPPCLGLASSVPCSCDQPIHVKIQNYQRPAALPVPDERRLGQSSTSAGTAFPSASRSLLSFAPFNPVAPGWFVASSSRLFDCSSARCVGGNSLRSFEAFFVALASIFSSLLAFHPCSPIFPEHIKVGNVHDGTKCTRVVTQPTRSETAGRDAAAVHHIPQGLPTHKRQTDRRTHVLVLHS